MDAKSRKRGVKASRAKLHVAMLEAGIKTQAALAEKIADQEGLSSPPKDTVNRAFRQESVSPTSVARIAKALDVEAYTLYLSSKEQATQVNSEPPIHSNEIEKASSSEKSNDNYSIAGQTKVVADSQEELTNSDTQLAKTAERTAKSAMGSTRVLISVGVILVSLLLVLLGRMTTLSPSEGANGNKSEMDGATDQSSLESAPNSSSHAPTEQSIGDIKPIFSLADDASIVIYSKAPITDSVSKMLERALKTDYKVTMSERTLVSQQAMAADIASQFQADVVFTIRNEIHSRYVILQGFLYSESKERLIWTGSFSKAELKYQARQISQQLLHSYFQAVGQANRGELLTGNVTELVAHQSYVHARELLDDYHSELNVKKAQAILLSTIAKHPNFVNVRAALCEVYLRESWRENEKESLQAASEECDKGAALTENNYYLTSVLGYLYRRSGRVADSIKLYQQTLKTAPDNVDNVAGIAMAYRDALRQQVDGFPDAEAQMLSFAKKATELEPDYWLHHNNLGILGYTAGRTELMASAFESAALLNPNEMAFANVGTINLCQGKIDKAIQLYRESIRVGPDAYVGYEMIGTAYLFSKEYDKSVVSKEKALSLMTDKEFGGLHQMWGDLGDAYRLNGKPASAIEAYKKALTIVHREKLRGNFSASDKAFNAYYILQLKNIDPDNHHEAELGFEYRELEALMTADVEASAKAKLAFSYYLLKDKKQARKAIKRATDVCIVYQKHPDYLFFEKQNSGEVGLAN